SVACAPERRIFLADWTFRLRQDHDAPSDRRFRNADLRRDFVEWPPGREFEAVRAKRQHRISELRALSSSHYRSQYSFRAGAPASHAGVRDLGESRSHAFPASALRERR